MCCTGPVAAVAQRGAETVDNFLHGFGYDMDDMDLAMMLITVRLVIIGLL